MESNKLKEICLHFEIDTKIRALAEFGLSYLNCAITAVAFRIFVFVFNNCRWTNCNNSNKFRSRITAYREHRAVCQRVC